MFTRIKKYIVMSKAEKKYKFRRMFFPNLISSSLFIQYLKDKGVSIGKGTVFHDPANTFVDIQRPWMLHIGEYCKITGGVTILVHDYSRSVLRIKYNEIIGEADKTYIGDNVFIGMNSIILMGSNIGSNCIIGAGSIVSGSFPDNSVIAGNPARVIMSLDDFYSKRKARCLSSAKKLCYEYYKKYNKAPLPKELGPFFPLFLEKTPEALEKNDIWLRWSGDDENSIKESFFNNSMKEYDNYDEFLKDVIKE